MDISCLLNSFHASNPFLPLSLASGNALLFKGMVWLGQEHLSITKQLISDLKYTCKFSPASNTSIILEAKAGAEDLEPPYYCPSHVSALLPYETCNRMWSVLFRGSLHLRCDSPSSQLLISNDLRPWAGVSRDCPWLSFRKYSLWEKENRAGVVVEVMVMSGKV